MDLIRPSRTARMPRFIGGVRDPDRALAELRLAVFGVGSVGRNIAIHAARLMPHELLLVDPGTYKDTSLLTQPIGPEDIGVPKAASTADLCRRISPTTRVLAFEAGLEDVDLAVLADTDVIFLATDNLLAEVEAAHRSVALGRPLIQASVHGDSLTAQVRAFTNRDGSGSCLLCGFGPDEWSHLDRATRFACTPTDPRGGSVSIDGPPTYSVSPLCSLAADMAVLVMLRMVLGLGGTLLDSLTEYNAYTARSVVSPLTRNPECPGGHRVWRVVDSPRPLAECSISELTRAARLDGAEHTHASLRVGAGNGVLPFVESTLCQCGHADTVLRFAPASRPCGDCGSVAEPNPFEAHDPVPVEAVSAVTNQPLAAVSDTPPTWVVVNGRDRSTMFRDPSPDLQPRESA